MRLRFLPRVLFAVCLASAIVAVVARRPAAAGDRTSRRSAEMALPDPYLDPSWPDRAGDDMAGRYAPGKSDSVEEVPLDEELEMQEELRALQELAGETPPAAAQAAPAVMPAPGAATEGVEGGAPAPMLDEPYDPQDDDEAPDLDQRDPVEW